MRVLLVSNVYPTRDNPTGAPFLRSRIHALDAHGVEVTATAVWPTWTAAARAVRAPLRSGGTQRPVPPFFPVTSPLGTTHAVRRRLGARSARRWLDATTDAVQSHVQPPVDVVHAHGMYDLPAGLVAQSTARRLGVPYVVSLHGTDVNSVLPRRVDLYTDVLTGAAATIYVSAALRDRAQQLVGLHPNTHVIPNGVDPAVFRPGARSDLPTVLYVGNLERVKGADRLPAIWREVRARVPEARLRVVGAGSLLARLRRALYDPSVTFLGRLEQAEVAREMARAHVLVLPSRAEGWPTVIMEAYATGTPVVGTAVGGIPEAVVEPACLVAEGPALEERIAEAVACVLERSARGPGDALRDVALDHTWDAVAAREIEVYRSC